MNKTIYIIRHGQTELNKQGIVQGSGVDAGLNETGQSQAKAFFQHYQHIPFEAVLTSALRRTHETMDPFIQLGLPWEKFEDINEIGWGIHEGKKSTPEMIQEYRTVIKSWMNGDFDAKLEEGESAAEMAARLQRFLDHLAERPEKLLLVCCHGRAMRCMMCLMQGQHLKEMENYKHSNTGLYKVVLENGRFEFILENDTSHLVFANSK